MAQKTARTKHLDIRVAPSEIARIQSEAARRNLTVAAYIRLVLTGEAQRGEDLVDRVAHRVSRDIDSATHGTSQRAVEESADRLLNALSVGLGIAVAAVTGRAVDEDLIDQMADRMREAYHYEDDDTDERTS